jgi:hypothetical protein
MTALIVAAEVVLPGWVGMFWKAVGQYHAYTGNELLLSVLVPWGNAGRMLAVCAFLFSALVLWPLRNEPAGTRTFGDSVALVAALTVLIVPMYAPYNQVLLLPAIFALARDRRAILSGSREISILYAAAIFALSWQWVASVALIPVYVANRSLALKAWKWPFFGTFTLPILVFALIAIEVERDRRALLATA